MNLKKINQVIKSEISLLNKSLKNEFAAIVKLIPVEKSYIFANQGKFLRATMFLLSYHIAGGRGDKKKSGDIVDDSCRLKIATAIELIHTATLLHDDVIDNGALRRWETSAKVVFGNSTAVLLGDYFYARAFDILSSVQNHKIIEILSKTAYKVSLGEIIQSLSQQYPRCKSISETEYLKTIKLKTAAFFAGCCECGAVFGNSNKNIFHALSKFGLNFGIAYQIYDDLIDLIGDEQSIGKTLRLDSANNKFTLPILYLIQEISVKQKIDYKKFSSLLDIWQKYSQNHPIVIEKTNNKIKHYINQSKQGILNIPDSVYKNILFELVENIYY